MRAATSLEEYHRAPEGTFRAGPTWLHLAWDQRTFATFFCGRPSPEDMRSLTQALRAEMTPHASPHVSHADVSRLDAVDPDAYGVLAEYMLSVRPLSATRILAQSIVYGSGLAGSVAAGFFTAYEAPFPFRAFREADEAAAWLGVAREALAEWEALCERVLGVPSELIELRAWLGRAAACATLSDAARALGVSTRTLQRRLLDHGTTFRRELDEVRLTAARARIDAGEEKLANLALELGFASHQHFADWFRRVTGESPSEYRARDRGFTASRGEQVEPQDTRGGRAEGGSRP